MGRRRKNKSQASRPETLEPEEDSSDTFEALPWDTGITFADVGRIMEGFAEGRKASKRDVLEALRRVTVIFEKLPNIVYVDVPERGHVTVCGDTHGQFFDLAKIFKLNGLPDENRNVYVFNGDFVDRGPMSVEVILTLMLLKLAVPAGIHLVRGNHESRFCTKSYGFLDEVKAKYNKQTYNEFMGLFAELPLGVIIHQKVLVVHGGLWASPSDSDSVGTLADLEACNRRLEPKDSGVLAEVLWSDPSDRIKGLSFNSRRGCGLFFGKVALRQFLDQNGLKMLVRSHEGPDTRPELMAGYCVDVEDACITVFSAPNYCGQHGNKAAYVRFSLPHLFPVFHQFSAHDSVSSTLTSPTCSWPASPRGSDSDSDSDRERAA